MHQNTNYAQYDYYPVQSAPLLFSSNINRFYHNSTENSFSNVIMGGGGKEMVKFEDPKKFASHYDIKQAYVI